MKILVTGATGKLGSKIVNRLLESIPAEQLAVSVRDPKKAKHLQEKGVEVRQGDFDQPDTLDTAFKGIDRLLLISADGDNETRIRQHTDAVAAAERAGVSFIAYTSLGDAENSNMFLAPPHQATEKAIKGSGMAYSFLRNNWYLENELGTIQAAVNGASWITSAASGRVGWAMQEDYAAAAAAVISGEGHDNTIYELSGTPLTQEELVAAVTKVTGKNIDVQQVNDEAYAEAMRQAGLPDEAMPFLLAIQKGIREGELDIESNDFEKLLGRPATSVEEALAQLLNN